MNEESTRKEPGNYVRDGPSKPKKPESHEIHTATIEGNVLGHDGENYTRGIKGAYAVLAVHWKDKDGKEHIHEITEKGIGGLKKEWPELSDLISQYSPHFQPRQTNDEGEFKFEEIPIGPWCYIVKAYYDDKKNPADHREDMGNDGLGGKDIIHGDDLHKTKARKGVVVPVKDDYIEENIPEPAKGPKWKKDMFEPGVR